MHNPSPSQIPQLLTLWKEVFGEHSGFWEVFLETAFSPQRCLCIADRETITASLCWLDTEFQGEKIAYLYAVVTHPAHRGKGLCRMLMKMTHAHLASLGYDAAMLFPADEGLRQMYQKLGYETCTWVSEFACAAGKDEIPLRAIGPGEYQQLRRTFLPPGGVLQEGKNLALLAQDCHFYVGSGFLMAAYEENGTLHALELLGDPQCAPGILAALHCQDGHFRCPGEDKPFAMFHPLQASAHVPSYFGFAFD